MLKSIKKHGSYSPK